MNAIIRNRKSPKFFGGAFSPWMTVSGTGCSSWQRVLRLVPCSQNSRCTAELSAGSHRRPWRAKRAWRNAACPSPSTACRTTWGRQTSASWRMWCSTPEENKSYKNFNECNEILSNHACSFSPLLPAAGAAACTFQGSAVLLQLFIWYKLVTHPCTDNYSPPVFFISGYFWAKTTSETENLWNKWHRYKKYCFFNVQHCWLYNVF